jgi:hypothetical protein
MSKFWDVLIDWVLKERPEPYYWGGRPRKISGACKHVDFHWSCRDTNCPCDCHPWGDRWQKDR